MNKIVIIETEKNKIKRKRGEINTVVIKKSGTKTTKVFTS